MTAASIGKFGFQLIGTSWSGIRLLKQAIAKNSQCTLAEQFGSLLTGHSSPPSDNRNDSTERAKLRIDRFQTACWLEAGKNTGLLWGHSTLTEQVGSLLDPPVKGVPRSPDFDPLDYFVCRHLDVPTVVLLRDGRACIPAKIKHENVSPPAAVEQWRFSVRAVRRFAFFNERCLVMRVEDAIAYPREIMGQLSDFLDIRYSDEMIEPFVAAQTVETWQYDPVQLARISETESWIGEIQEDLHACGYKGA
jgi:hypothetical protein